MPAPTSGTVVLDPESEDADNQLKRELWIESMHRTAEGTSWRKIELQNRQEQIRARKNNVSRDGQEEIADGLLYGEWFELGSQNQAGSVHVTEYDAEADQIWTVADGGTIYKGNRDGSWWGVVNQDYRFSSHVLKFIPFNDGRRLIASIEGIPAYSNDDGQNWFFSSGIDVPSDGFSGTRNYVIHENGEDVTILCLSKRDYWSPFHIYISKDEGETYKSIKELDSHESRNFVLMSPNNSNQVFLMSKGGASRAIVHEVDVENEVVIELFESELILGQDERIFFTGYQENQVLTFLSVDKENRLNISTDLGQTWKVNGNLGVRPWSVGLFVCLSDPTQMFFGEVECHKALGGGLLWNKVNNWGDYYSDVEGALHADIMYFNEFYTSDNVPFQLVSNHGGLSISYNYLETVQNIGLKGLNVSQYYDVKTDPRDPDFIYAGSQDQGFQRGRIDPENGPSDLDQVISGDYGHITFSRDGEGMWFVYPGGSVSFYNNPQFGVQTASYNVESDNESVWIPPLQNIPGSSENKIYMAGGSDEGGAGSYIIELRYWAGGIQSRNLPFDFFDYSGGEVCAIEVSPINPFLMYASTTDGSFFYSTDGGENWELSMIIAPTPHYLYGTTIHASQVDENVVYIGGSGYNNPAVYYSNDMGQTFVAFDKGLPSTLVLELTANEDESMFFAATEAGPFVYLRDSESWHSLYGQAAPNTRYWSVEWIEQDQIARFGTYGRGAWDFQVQEFVANENLNEVQTNFKVFPNPVGSILNIESLNFGNHTDIKIFNTLGQLVLNMEKTATREATSVSIDVSNLNPGNYTITIVEGNDSSSQSFIKM